jgi:hypothetical protein
MINKTEIYQARLVERIGCVPDGSKIEVTVIFRDKDSNRALVYFPSTVKYCAPGTKAWKEAKNSDCCGSLVLSEFDSKENVWKKLRGEDDGYINLGNKEEIKLIMCLTSDEKKVSVPNGNQRKSPRKDARRA